ncbi:MAG: phage tail tape measure protein [Ruminococcus sp.]|nr:phage tail tape measure protein [Ruminococcus sp.]
MATWRSIGKSKGISVYFTADVTAMGKAIRKIDTEVKELDADLKEVNKGLKLDPTNTDLMAKKLKLLVDESERVNARLAELKSMKEQMDKVKVNELSYDDRVTYEEQFASLNREIQTTENKVANFRREIKNTGEAIRNELINGFNQLRDSAATAFKVIAAGEAALTALAVAATKTGAEFDAVMSKVAATLNITKDSYDFTRLRDTAIEMGRTTTYTATDAAEALNFLALAGFNAEKSMETLPKVLTLAKAGSMDLGNAANMVVAAISALGLSSEDTDKLIDQMARTSQKSKTTVEEMGETILKSAAAFNIAGQSTETMSAIIGTLANRFEDISAQGNTLRTALTKIMTNADKLAEIGVTIKDSSGQVRDFIDIFTDLRKALETKSPDEQASMLTSIFGTRGYSYVKYLMDSTKGEIQGLRSMIVDSSGAATAMADTMTDNLQGDLIILKSATESLQIAISDKLTPSFRETTQEGARLVNGLTRDVRRGELGEILEDFGNKLNEFIENGVTSLIEVLPTIIKYLEKIMEHGDIIAGLLVGLAIDKFASNAVSGILHVFKALYDLKALLVEASTAAALLKAVFSVNGIGAIATVIGLGTGAFAAYKTSVALATEQTEEFSKETQNALDKAQEMSEAIEDSKKTFEESTGSIENNYDSLDILVDKLYAIADGQETTSAKMRAASSLVDELNSKIPDLNLNYDSTTNSLSKQRGELEKIIELRKQEAMQEAYADRANVIAGEIVDAEDTRDTLLERKAAEEKARRKAKAERDRIQSEIDANKEKYKNDETALQQANGVIVGTSKATGETGYDAPGRNSSGLYYELYKANTEYEKRKRAVEDLGIKAFDLKSDIENLNRQLERYTSYGSFDEEVYGPSFEGSENFVGPIKEATESYEDLNEEQKKALNTVIELSEAEEDNSDQIARLIEQNPELEEALEELGYDVSDLTSSTSALSEEEETLADKLEKANTAVTNSRTALTEYIDLLKQVSEGTAFSTSQMLELIEKYPELAGAIQLTRNGYILEKEAVEELVKAKADKLKQDSFEALQLAEQQYWEVARSGHATSEDENEAYQAWRRAKGYYDETSRITATIKEGHIIYSVPEETGGSDNYGYADGTPSDTTDYWKQAAESEISEAEHLYNMGEISAEDYYNRLADINRRYYESKAEYLNEYNDLAEKVYSGLKEAQEDDLSNAKELEERIRSVTEAENKLKNADKQEVSVYSSAAGFHSEKNTSAISEAQQDLHDARYSLAQTLLKLGKFDGSGISAQLGSLNIGKLKNMLPDLSKLSVPISSSSAAVQSGTSAKSFNITVNYTGGDIILQGKVDEVTVARVKRLMETEFKELFLKCLNDYLNQLDLDRMTGG